MSWINLRDYQQEAIEKMHNGCILCGDVGSGKSRTSIAYYFKEQGGELYSDDYTPMNEPRDLYIITTARKRDTLEWEQELAPFLLSTHEDLNYYNNKVTVDSWNNVYKYIDRYGAFFIFDEQRVVGSGSWVKAFLKIAVKNQWILLSATPGDKWHDYVPVFVANGFFRHKTDFERQHVVWNRFTKYPKVDRYINQGTLIKYRSQILVRMKDQRTTRRHYQLVLTGYDIDNYNMILKDRWDIYEEEPIKEISKMCYLLRRVCNEDPSRIVELTKIVEDNPKVIIFYNFNYELALIRDMLTNMQVPFAEWNGEKHEPIPSTDSWAYVVQYSAGAEGWNCIETNVVVLYSQNYSYKITHQAEGRIDRINTPYKDLYYYILRSSSSIDLAIARDLHNKGTFNEKAFLGE